MQRRSFLYTLVVAPVVAAFARVSAAVLPAKTKPSPGHVHTGPATGGRLWATTMDVGNGERWFGPEMPALTRADAIAAAQAYPVPGFVVLGAIQAYFIGRRHVRLVVDETDQALYDYAGEFAGLPDPVVRRFSGNPLELQLTATRPPGLPVWQERLFDVEQKAYESSFVAGA